MSPFLENVEFREVLYEIDQENELLDIFVKEYFILKV